MKIYTKTGDDGTTSLLGGKRTYKDNLRIETYGTVDELNSVIGICRALKPVKKIDKILEYIQNQLFVLGAELASIRKTKAIPKISDHDIKFLEDVIDNIESENFPLKNFIVPGGTLLSAHLQLARSVCRRAERHAVRLFKFSKKNKLPIVYLNRLSDLFFVLSRWVNKKSNFKDVVWKKNKI